MNEKKYLITFVLFFIVLLVSTSEVEAQCATGHIENEDGTCTYTWQVGASSDDTWWEDGTSHPTSGYLAVGYRAFTSKVVNIGVRFTGVNIPDDSTINSAYLKYYEIVAEWGTQNTRVYGIAADDPTAPTRNPLTSEYVDWDNPGLISHNINLIVQEIIDRPGWISGNALCLYHKDDGSSTVGENHIRYSSYDSASSKAPELEVTYTPPPQDSDGDGVPDNSDACPNTNPGDSVNAFGCCNSDGCTDTAVIKSESGNGFFDDGFLERRSTPAPRTKAEASASVPAVRDTFSYLAIGQRQGHVYYIYRSYVSFDTSVLPSSAEVDTAVLFLKTSIDGSTNYEFFVQIMGGEPQPLLGGDLGADDWGLGTTLIDDTFHTPDYPGDDVYVSLDVSSQTINTEGRTQFELRSDRDANCDEAINPGDAEFIRFHSGDSANNEPYLEVTYNIPFFDFTAWIEGPPIFTIAKTESVNVYIKNQGTADDNYNITYTKTAQYDTEDVSHLVDVHLTANRTKTLEPEHVDSILARVTMLGPITTGSITFTAIADSGGSDSKSIQFTSGSPINLPEFGFIGLIQIFILISIILILHLKKKSET